MLSINNVEDINKMKEYYRTSDMISLLEFFPEISPIRNLTIIENEADFHKHYELIKTLDSNRVDSLKTRGLLTGIENSGHMEDFPDTIRRIKEKDSEGVMVFFNVEAGNSERYARHAGISVGVDLGQAVYIDAVGQGFDGREVSKSICTHERYYIPWFDLRKCSIGNFKDYQTFQTTDEAYVKTRLDRVNFLKSIGLNPEYFEQFIPETYQPIPDKVWLSVIRGILKRLEEREEFLQKGNFTHFAISGHTENGEFTPWQMFDKSRYTLSLTNSKRG